MKTKVEVYDKSTERLIESYCVEVDEREAKVGWINKEVLRSDAYMVCDCVGDADNGKAGLLYLSKVDKSFYRQYLANELNQREIPDYDIFSRYVQWGLDNLMDAEGTFAFFKKHYDLSTLWAVQFSDIAIELFYSPLHGVREKYYDIAFQYLTRNKLLKFIDCEKEEAEKFLSNVG